MRQHIVVAPGARGTHGCSAYAIVEGVRRWLTPNPETGATNVSVEGTIVEKHDCPFCGEVFPEKGKTVKYEGWYYPSYYGHRGIQL
jgi:hypothetical protein